MLVSVAIIATKRVRNWNIATQPERTGKIRLLVPGRIVCVWCVRFHLDACGSGVQYLAYKLMYTFSQKIKLIGQQTKEILTCPKYLNYKLCTNPKPNSVTIGLGLEHSFIFSCVLLLLMSVLKYLDDKNPGRRRGCIGAIKLFLDHVYGITRHPHGYVSQEERERYEQLASDYVADTGRDKVQDLISFRKNSTMAAKTCQVYLGIIKEFLEVNGYELSKADAKKLKKVYQGGEEAPLDAPDHGMIRSYLEHADPRMKAIALLLSSTGMRIGELLSISESSIDFDRRMITLKAQDTKTKTGRVVFFTRESEKALNHFLKVRTRYINEANAKAAKFGEDTQTVDDGRIFPYTPTSINRAWNRNLKHSGQFARNDRMRVLFHPHALRQFFSTQLRKNSCPDSVVEILLGHKPYLSTYIRFSPAELQEAYEKYSPALVIGTADDVRRTVNALADKAMQTNGMIEDLKKRNTEQEEKIAALERKLISVQNDPAMDNRMLDAGWEQIIENLIEQKLLERQTPTKKKAKK